MPEMSAKYGITAVPTCVLVKVCPLDPGSTATLSVAEEIITESYCLIIAASAFQCFS